MALTFEIFCFFVSMEGMILRSTLRVLLASRFHPPSSNARGGGGVNGEEGATRGESLWERVTSGDPRGVCLDGDPAIYEMLGEMLLGCVCCVCVCVCCVCVCVCVCKSIKTFGR